MRSICAWCLKDLGRVKDSRHSDAEISHGICPSCMNNVEFQEGTSLRKYIDSFAVPILLVDSNVRVLAVNRTASEILGKKPDQVISHLGGEVFECECARLPGGCGKTVHCSGCTIRQTVTRCYTTGEPEVDIPAYLNPDGPMELTISITTIKIGDSVALKVNSIARK